MRNAAAVLAVGLLTIAGWAQDSPGPAQSSSPAERSVNRAERLIVKNPKDFEAYNALALALSRRARETSDVSFYAKSDQALQKSFEISPGNVDGERTRIWVLLGKHEFAAALNAAKALNLKLPNDIMVYGFLTDANVELGNYKDAETAAQRILDLRAGNIPGLTRAAYLRELFGDVDGALDLMQTAYESTPMSESEDRAWILTQMAHLQLSIGRTQQAEALLMQALAAFPGYHYALGNLAKLRIQQKRYTDAVTLLEQRYRSAPHAENLYDLAEALQLAGRTDDANRAFSEFERKSLLETNRADNSNHELTFYYVDHAHEPTKALEVARREFERRHDVFTVEAYAWTLFNNGRYVEARRQIEGALAVGLRDAKFYRHAADIAEKCGDASVAQKYRSQATRLSATEPATTVGSVQSLPVL